MTRTIEQKMLDAVSQKRNFKEKNTRVIVDDDGRVDVYLWDNHIATVRNGTVEPNIEMLKKWPTRTTVSRLNTLGVNARIRNHHPEINEKPV